jgi:hypothetical protein
MASLNGAERKDSIGIMVFGHSALKRSPGAHNVSFNEPRRSWTNYASQHAGSTHS